MKRGAALLRFLVVGAAVFGPLGAVLYRAVSLQWGQGRDMRQMAEEQYLGETRLSAPRGNILDRAGRPLAVSVKVPSVFADPRMVGEAKAGEVARALAAILGEPAPVLEKKLASKKGFTWLARRVKPEVAQAVKRLGVPGIGLTDESRRFYPNRELAAHVLGFTNVDGRGMEGVEAAYDGRLVGEDKSVDGFRDARGARLLLGELSGSEPVPGEDVTLTLDAQVQFIAEQAIARAVTAHGAVGGFALVMEPSTGAVLGMASYPTFNPNDLKKVKPDARRNRAVVDAFEPGSTMKAMLLAAALDANVVRINDVIDCENGVFKVGRHRIRDTHKAGLLTVAEVVAQSSNIGSLKIGTMMGRQRWGAALSAYGFGRRTGLGLGGESPGLMWPAERWSDATLATTSFGQGISVTGVQMTSALAALANGGVLMQPRVVERIRSADGRTVEELGPVVVRRVVGAKAAQSTLRALEAVVGPTGTAPLATVPGVLVAGKTGTAQKVDPGARGYGDKRVASFVGVAPSRDPRLVIMVMVDEPADSPYGGVVAAPAFREIAMAALPLMGVSVESTPPVAPAVAAGKVEGADILAATRKLRERLAADDPADGIEPDVVDGTPGVARVPDLTGKSPRAAVREALAAGLEPALEGSGVVVSQRPEAGSPMPTPRAVKLRLGPQGEQGG